MSKDRTKQTIAQLNALRAGSEAELMPHVRTALGSSSPYVVAKAAEIAAERFLFALVPDLLAAFDRLIADSEERDPLAEALVALAHALKELDCRDAAVYLRGLHHRQYKSAWKIPVEVAGPLRSVCALALVACDLDDAALLREFVDALVLEKEKTVRIDVVRAIGEIGGTAGMALLRLKALTGDTDPEVIGECLAVLMAREPRESLPFAVRFLSHDRDECRFEAACILAGSAEPGALTAVTAYWQTSLSSDMRRAVVLSLGTSQLPAAADFLLSLIADPRPDVAATAIGALATSRFREAVRERVRAAVVATGDGRLQTAYEAEFRPAEVRGRA